MICFSVAVLFLACVVWGAWLNYITTAEQDTCGPIRYLQFLPPENGYYLKGHTFVNLSIGTRKSCEEQCLMQRECVSINIGPPINNIMACELSDSDHFQDRKAIKPRHGWTYRGTENICATFPCLNNGKCYLGYTDKKYLCVCPAGYTGENCERDINECMAGTHDCHKNANCTNIPGSFDCSCKKGFIGDGRLCSAFAKSCSNLQRLDPKAESGNYVIDPDGEGGLAPFAVYCNMTDKSGVGVTVIGHNSESRTFVDGCDPPGCYSRDIHYTAANLFQLANLTIVSSNCEQFIKYECYDSMLLSDGDGWWVSRDSIRMTYWGGASPGSGKCACGMNNSCADSKYGCNCDKNDFVWREDSGLLTDKTKLPVKQLRFGDVGKDYGNEQGYHILGKLKCYGTA